MGAEVVPPNRFGSSPMYNKDRPHPPLPHPVNEQMTEPLPPQWSGEEVMVLEGEEGVFE